MAESFKKLSENDQKDVETETQSEGNTTNPNPVQLCQLLMIPLFHTITFDLVE